jgi:hypothetical protein
VPVAALQRAPVGHAALDSHRLGHVALAPSQANGAHVGAPDDLAGRSVHVPAGAAHVSHGASQRRSQHKPAEQIPVVHSSSRAHDLPAFTMHAPAASHARSPAQLSRSSALVTIAQVPGVFAHDRQASLQGVSQHTPSAQARDTHSASVVHAAPTATPDETNRARTR